MVVIRVRKKADVLPTELQRDHALLVQVQPKVIPNGNSNTVMFVVKVSESNRAKLRKSKRRMQMSALAAKSAIDRKTDRAHSCPR